MTRLETLCPELYHAIRSLPDVRRHEATMWACECAVAASHLTNPDIGMAMNRMRSDGVPPTDMHNQLAELAERLDTEYLAMRSAAEGAGTPHGDWLARFNEGQAAAALACATESTTIDSAVEAIYEAALASDDPRAFAEQLVIRLARL
jgi:hypothetical protein